MAKERITPERIRKFTCPTEKSQAFLWDTEAPRLAVRATTKSKSFIFESKLDKQTIRVTIGDTKSWSIDDARSEARRLQTLIDQGKDPRIEKAETLASTRAKQEELKRKETPAIEAWNLYIQTRQPRWSKSHLADHIKVSTAGGIERTRGRRPNEADTTQPGILFELLQHPLSSIDAVSVRRWLQIESLKRPTHTRLAFALLRAFLNWCGDQPQFQQDVHLDACLSRFAKEELPRKNAKDDCLQREQLSLWFKYVSQIQNPYISAYLQTLLITGSRREEMASLKWQDVDFQWKSIKIADKVEDSRVIPLTPYVEWLLMNLPRQNEFVFSSSSSASGHITEPRIQHNKALQAAGLPPLTLHGLRRSFGTLCEWVEMPAGISAQIMGHKPSAIAEKHYRKRPLDLLRSWHIKIEEWILEQAGLKQAESESLS